MENPYHPPAKAAALPPPAFQWRRVLTWSVLIFVAANLVGILSGFTMANWQMYGDTMPEAVANARLVRRIGYGIVGAILYWRFAAGLRSKRLLHVLAVFILVQVIDLSISYFVYAAPLDSLFNAWALGRSLLASAVGAGAAVLGEKLTKPRG